MPDFDVIVVGAGNAAMAAAVSAREQGAARVVMLEKAPRELRGGNTHYSGGLLRFAYDRPEDLLPLVPDDARFNDAFSSLDLRVSRPFALGPTVRVEPMLEVFNLFNTTNILGLTTVNYSGYSNVLVRDSDDPASPGFLRSTSFGQPVTTAGGVFGSGGPRAMQLAVRVTF